MDLKRYAVKMVRDRAKSAYVKADTCEICGTTDELELHHYASMAELWNAWCLKKKIRPTTVEEMLPLRDAFIEEHHKQIYVDVVTLCKKHHEQLHLLFGRNPPVSTAIAQGKWVNVRKNKELLGPKQVKSGSTSDLPE
jgi:hypothetical protein